MMNNSKIKTEEQVDVRLTPEMLGLVKKSTLETQQKQPKLDQTVNSNNGLKVPDTNGNNSKAQSDDDDIKIINEKISNLKQEPIKKEVEQEEKIVVKLKPEEFILDDEEVGFPSYLKGWVTRGRTIPINKKTWTEIDIEGNDAILECPSQVVPLFIKKPHIFPLTEKKKDEPKEVVKEEDEDEKKENEKSEEAQNEVRLDDKKEEDKEKSEKDEKLNEKKEDDSDKIKEEKSAQPPSTNNEQQQSQPQQTKITCLTIDDYYKSSVGSFLMGIGLRRCQETYLKDAVKQTQKLIRKEGELDEHMDTLRDQQEQYDDCKAVNSIYTFKQEKCKFCDFRTDSESVMEHHLSIPHISNRKEYKCNYCSFLSRDSRVIQYHFLNDHKKHCNIELPLNLYTCPTCNYESNQKGKSANHMAKCSKVFTEDKVMHLPDPEPDLPAITSKLITQDDLKLYESAVQALKQVAMNPNTPVPDLPGLPNGLRHQILALQQQQFARQKVVKPKTATGTQRSTIANQRPIGTIINPSIALANGGNLIGNINFAKANAPQLYHMLQTGSINNNQLLTNLQQQAKQNVTASTVKLPQQLNSRTINLPLHAGQMVNKNLSNMKAAMMNNNKNVKDTNGQQKDTFVICEICDGYIKDLEQLRTHMSWVHKVKIHPKMIASRPPLNCQKCQWRFFTDQGLERHLLGAHGLVTSNMQDLVDQDQDGGRCTICGKAFASKLVSHMNQVHKITLRPAHLSYKCTVCSATFNLYRLFESHVYMVHSSAKRVNDDQLNQLNKKPRTQTIEIGKATVNGS